MLTNVANGVFVHTSDWCESNSVVVLGKDGVLVVDPGISAIEVDDLAADVKKLGQTVVAGFATHPHWDHLLWSAALGDVPRYATGTAATTARHRLSTGIDRARFGIPEDVSFEAIGDVTGLPDGATELPSGGHGVRILEHRAHAPGHAGLLIEGSGVLVAGDMLSDGFIPMLDLMGAADPFGDYLAALDLFESVAGDVRFVIPGHGSVGDAAEFRRRIDQDRAYLLALTRGREVTDSRIGPSAKPGWEWVRDIHEGQLARLAQRP